MKTYKLKYGSKELGIKDLEKKKITSKNKNVLGIVYVGNIVYIKGVYNELNKEITPTEYLEGYHIDIACKEDIYDFGVNETFPANPKHKIN